MSLDAFSDLVAAARQHFEEGLIRAGFVEHKTGWNGVINHPTGPTVVVITMPSRFPFVPPRVLPVDSGSVPWSWHRELDGALCLVAEDDHEDLWWREAPAFLEHVKAWFTHSDAGWIDDRPDLDLERYFEPAEDERLYLYDDLDQHRNRLVRFAPGQNNTMRLKGRGTRPTMPSKYNKNMFGYVADLGDIDTPPRNWYDLATRLDPSADLERRIRGHLVDVLVLCYNRGGHKGATVLRVRPTNDGEISLRRLRAGAETNAARSARSGRHASEVGSRHVAVVGVGALGSFIADMLIRSGIQRLTLIDSDILTPGNLVRHLVGPDAVGLPKVAAVKRHLVDRHDVKASDIDVHTEDVTTGETAIKLLNEHDLVINATADFALTALLYAATATTNGRFLSAALQNGGDTYRIDILPPLDGAAPLPGSTNATHQPAASYFEAGCGSPISPAPPHAVIEAAAVAVRHAIGFLIADPIHPSGEVRHLIPVRVTA